MASLFIVAESERDQDFYELLAEKATGRAFDRADHARLPQGSNWKTALAAARLLLKKFGRLSSAQEIAIIVAVDNDRAPGHPGATPPARPLVGVDRKKTPRYPALMQMFADALGPSRENWPVDVALAMPVEMIESWVLLLCDPARPSLPIFAESSQPLARAYHGDAPPPQLKDLCKREAAAAGKSLEQYFWFAAEQNLNAAAAVSKSLKMFLEELRSWRSASQA
jgi:hypothetical protein